MPLAYFADNDGNLYADMICEGMSLEYSGLAPAAALCDISLPQNAVPGEYTVRISLFSSRGLRKETKRDEYSLKLKIKEGRLPELTEFGSSRAISPARSEWSCSGASTLSCSTS